MALFLDTSALVKLFVSEAGSGDVAAITAESHPVNLGSLTPHEFLSAIHRRARERSLSDQEATAAIVKFRDRFLPNAVVIPFDRAVSVRAFSLVERHRATGLRVLDAVQLACCLEIPDATFVLADHRLAGIAQAQGVSIRLIG
jgi:predicted nucleic acid-binding protein